MGTRHAATFTAQQRAGIRDSSSVGGGTGDMVLSVCGRPPTRWQPDRKCFRPPNVTPAASAAGCCWPLSCRASRATSAIGRACASGMKRDAAPPPLGLRQSSTKQHQHTLKSLCARPGPPWSALACVIPCQLRWLQGRGEHPTSQPGWFAHRPLHPLPAHRILPLGGWRWAQLWSCTTRSAGRL